MTKSQDLTERANELESQAQALREQASEAKRKELLAMPLLDRLVFAAYARCECGAGMAYDPASQDGPFKRPSEWKCSDIILFPTKSPEDQARLKAVVHNHPLPFATYEVKSEKQPSANGATTRPAKIDEARG